QTRSKRDWSSDVCSSDLVKGTKTGTTTDENGTFSLSLTGESQTLVFSFVGYQKKEVPINGRTTLNVMLREEVVEMDDIVVVGYRSEERRVGKEGRDRKWS